LCACAHHPLCPSSRRHSICGIQIAGFENPFQFCSLFERANHMELMRKMELLQDLGDFYKKGTGDPNAYTMSCTLLEDFIMTADVSGRCWRCFSRFVAARCPVNMSSFADWRGHIWPWPP
jgi:hypothetical protein